MASCCNNYPGKNYCADCGANLAAVQSGSGSYRSVPLFHSGSISIGYPYSGSIICGSIPSGLVMSGMYTGGTLQSGSICSGTINLNGSSSGTYISGIMGGLTGRNFHYGVSGRMLGKPSAFKQDPSDQVVSIPKKKNPFYVHNEW
ncbi:hypothetical protein C4577_01910 [Candidatus Parcubacteria bacterium]|nr:MAG: hypothetical protein C4577_01910 [Candidatus Parcubacteria bacterium]